MGAEHRGAADRPGPDGPWRVRVRDEDGVILGAGVLVGTGHVLTCAHVIPVAGEPAPSDARSAPSDARATPPDTRVLVDLVCLPDSPTAHARVLDDCWAPPEGEKGEERGDVALLVLDRHLPDGMGAPLRRLPVSLGREVRSYGFPDGAPAGMWARATVAGSSGPGGEWVQMDALVRGNRPRRGFSGAAVVDQATGYVIGMMVSEFTEGDAGVSWMLPIETIVAYVPLVSEWVGGDVAVDPTLARDFDSWSQDVGFARQIAEWFARAVRGSVWPVVTGGADSAVAANLRRAAVLGSRELRPPAVGRAPWPEGTVPPVGSVDLAMDVSHRTVEEVARRIADRIGLPADEETEVVGRVRNDPPLMTVVVDGVDQAERPEELISEVLRPLADRGLRLVLGFRSESSPGLSVARSWQSSHPPAPGDDTASLRRRLDELEQRLAELAEREDEVRRRRDHVATRVTAVPAMPERASRLRMRWGSLRVADLDRDREWVAPELRECERSVSRALARLASFEGRLDRLLDRRRELRGLLAAYQARAADHGLAEDDELDDAYRAAHATLWTAPCDLIAAADRVARYQRAVRRRIEGGSGGGWR